MESIGNCKETMIADILSGATTLERIYGTSPAGANEFDPALFIIMRAGVDSMNVGKAIAQACHAQSQAAAKLRFRDYEPNFLTDKVTLRRPRTYSSAQMTVMLDKEDCTHDTRDWMMRCHYNVWENTARKFGVTYTWQYEAVRENGYERFDDAMETLLEAGRSLSPYVTGGTVVDPTYPISDGSVTHLVPFATCGWLFGDVNTLKALLNTHRHGYSFHP